MSTMASIGTIILSPMRCILTEVGIYIEAKLLFLIFFSAAFIDRGIAAVLDIELKAEIAGMEMFFSIDFLLRKLTEEAIISIKNK